jgi:predicted dehydrogenase
VGGAITIGCLGIIGPGNIAEKFARDIKLVPQALLVSVASSDPKRAMAFAERFKIPKAAQSYFHLLNDPEIDAVYIATIHPTHYTLAKQALMAGKHVLIEKPLTMNAAQAQTLMSLSHERGLFLMEAMWTAFLPVTQAVCQLARSGALGPIQKLEGAFCISTTETNAKRLHDPTLGGGALLDLGVYPLSFAHLIMGSSFSGVSSHMKITKGVDQRTEIRLTYPGGAMANLCCDITEESPLVFRIHSEKGVLEVPHFIGANSYSILSSDGKRESFSLPFHGEGFVEQIRASLEAILKGEQESKTWSHHDTLCVLRLMDKVRQDHALHYDNLESI